MFKNTTYAYNNGYPGLLGMTSPWMEWMISLMLTCTYSKVGMRSIQKFETWQVHVFFVNISSSIYWLSRDEFYADLVNF